MKPPRRLEKKGEGFDPRVEQVVLKSRALLVVGVGRARSTEVAGAVVWVKPEKGDSAEDVAAAVDHLKKKGAARVLPMPLEAQDAAVPEAEIEFTGEFKSARAVVEDLLVRVSEQPDDVRAVVEAAMNEVGL